MSKTYEMDGVSLLFPALGGHLYRMTAVFNENVDSKKLRKAIANLADAFPIMFTHLDKTFSGYIHRKANDYDVIVDGEKWINTPSLTDTVKPSFRVYVDKNLFSVDFFHGNADGHIANAFMSALVDSYCALLENKVMPVLPVPSDFDLEDPYDVFYRKSKTNNVLEKPSYELKLKKEPYEYHRLACFEMDINEVKSFTKKYGCSINDFLCAIYYKAIIDATSAKNSKKDVTLSIGIDLRKFYDCNTHRNFDYYCNIRFNESCKNSFDNTIKTIRHQVKNALKAKNVMSGVGVVHNTAHNPIVKYSPRVLKDFVVKNCYHAVYDTGITSTISNIGYHKVSDDSKKHLKRMELYLNIFDEKVNAAAVGCKDKLTLNLTYNSKDKTIDEALGKIIKSFGINYNYSQREFY